MEWNHPFNVAVISLDEVVNGSRDVLLVMHDEGHGGWQFYDGDDVSGRPPAVVPRELILSLDPTLADVIDLPVGWLARRPARGQPWQREQFA